MATTEGAFDHLRDLNQDFLFVLLAPALALASSFLAAGLTRLIMLFRTVERLFVVLLLLLEGDGERVISRSLSSVDSGFRLGVDEDVGSEGSTSRTLDED